MKLSYCLINDSYRPITDSLPSLCTSDVRKVAGWDRSPRFIDIELRSEHFEGSVEAFISDTIEERKALPQLVLPLSERRVTLTMAQYGFLSNEGLEHFWFSIKEVL